MSQWFDHPSTKGLSLFILCVRTNQINPPFATPIQLQINLQLLSSLHGRLLLFDVAPPVVHIVCSSLNAIVRPCTSSSSSPRPGAYPRDSSSLSSQSSRTIAWTLSFYETRRAGTLRTTTKGTFLKWLFFFFLLFFILSPLLSLRSRCFGVAFFFFISRNLRRDERILWDEADVGSRFFFPGLTTVFLVWLSFFFGGGFRVFFIFACSFTSSLQHRGTPNL